MIDREDATRIMEPFIGEASSALDWMTLLNRHGMLWNYTLRDVFIRKASFSIPTTEVLDRIAKWVGKDRVVEHMAGSGYWGYLLEKLGIRIECFDSGEYDKEDKWVRIWKRDGEMRVEDAEGVDLGMASWVPCGFGGANRWIRNCKKLIYIGERGGCCGDSETDQILESDFREIECLELVQWSGIHDYCWLLESVL